MAIPFVEERFNTEFRYGLVGGPEFSTAIVETDSGVEQVNANWSEGLGRWTTGPDLYTRAEIDWLLKFFTNRKGQAVAFRFKAWEDFEVSINEGVMARVASIFGAPMQLYKRYASESAYTDKIIRKPIAANFKLYANGALQPSGWSLDTTTGLVSLASYVPGTIYAWSGEFDKPVRFTTDKFECEFMTFREQDGERLFQVTGLGVKEVRLPLPTVALGFVSPDPLPPPPLAPVVVVVRAPLIPPPIVVVPVVGGTTSTSAPSITVADRGDVFLQVGDYWYQDGVWGATGLTRGPAGSYTGLNGTVYEQAIGVSPVVGPNGEVAGRVKFSYPTGTTEVKSYPTFLVGKKPGFANTWIGPGGIPIYLLDGSIRQINPSGPTPNTYFPLQLPVTTLKASHAYVHNSPPTGKGHLSYDIWFQNIPEQTSGFNSQNEITHEIMIPVMYWGDYGRSDRRADGTFGPNQGRNPGWYDSDTVIDGKLYHIYRPHNPDGSFIPFGGGWHFIVFEPDVILAPQQVEQLNLVSFFNFIRSKGWATNQYVSSVELGIETIEGTGDVTTYGFNVTNV